MNALLLVFGVLYKVCLGSDAAAAVVAATTAIRNRNSVCSRMEKMWNDLIVDVWK